MNTLKEINMNKKKIDINRPRYECNGYRYIDINRPKEIDKLGLT